MKRILFAVVLLVVTCAFCARAQVPLYTDAASRVTMARWSAHTLQNEADLKALEFADGWCDAEIPPLLQQRVLVYPGVKKKGDWNTAKGCLYRADIQVDFAPDTEQLLLTLPYTMHTATLFVDDKQVALLWDETLPQTVDLTPHVRPGQRHSLAIRTLVADQCEKTPTGK